MAKARNAAVASMGATEDEIRSLVLEVEELDTEVATLRHWMQGSAGKVVNGDGVEVDNEYARQQALAIELATVEDRVNVFARKQTRTHTGAWIHTLTHARAGGGGYIRGHG